MSEEKYVLRTTSFDTGETVETELNQTEGAVYPEEFMAGMDAEVLKKAAEFSGVEVPLYFDNGVDERTLVGTASIEPDGEVLMHVDPESPIADAMKVKGQSMPAHPEIWMESGIEEVWAKRRTY